MRCPKNGGETHPGRNQEKCFQGGNGATALPFWHDFFQPTRKPEYLVLQWKLIANAPQNAANRRKTPQNTTKHRKTPQNTAKHRKTPQNTAKCCKRARGHCQFAAKHQKTPQNAAKCCKTLQNAAKRRKTPQNTTNIANW